MEKNITGGKSYGLLIEPLRYKNNKRFGAVIFRHEYKQIFNQGGLWDTSNDGYKGSRWKIQRRYVEVQKRYDSCI
jgi:hypothetical protein